MAAFALYIHAPEIQLADLLRSIYTVTFQRPADSIRIAADCVMQTILLRYHTLFGELSVKYTIEIFLEIPHKDLAALARQNTTDTLLFLLQVIENVRQPVTEAVMLREIVLVLAHDLMRENVIEYITANRFQKLVLRLKVGIECRSADVGLVNDVLHG